MSTSLGDTAKTVEAIVVNNDGMQTQQAQPLYNGVPDRRRRPRRSFVTRPMGVQFRSEFQYFRVR